MLNEGDEEVLGKFVLGISAIKSPEHSITFKLQSMNANMPIEAVVLQLESFLRNIKRGYFSKFDTQYDGK